MNAFLAAAGFATLIILHELGHMLVAKAVGMRVERFALFFPPYIWRRKHGETEYAIGTIPLGGFVKITGMNPHEEIPEEIAERAYFRQKVWKRIAVIAAGPAVNIVLAFVILWVIFATATFAEPTRSVGEVEKNTPAAGALRPGDEVLAVDGVRKREELSRQISTHRCAPPITAGCRAQTPAKVEIRRDGRVQTVSLTPFYDGELERTRLGFRFGERPLEYGVGAAAGESVKSMWEFTSRTVSTIAQLFKSEKREELSGVVGSYEVTRQAVSLNLETAFYVLAVISLSLGVINLFPFLPLDGGHIFWALAEKIRGRAIPFSVMERAGFVGFFLVICLFVIGLSNDIERLTGEGIQIRPR